jgi:voltage-gated potassium channel
LFSGGTIRPPGSSGWSDERILLYNAMQMGASEKRNPGNGWREALRIIVFEADTPAGKAFDVGLILSILLSVVAVMLDSVGSVRRLHGGFLYSVEWFFTVVFTVEYILRLIISERPSHYAKSFFGMVDLVAVLPTYISILMPGAQYLLVIRVLRVLRVFRILKFVQYIREASALKQALISSSRKINVFIFTILTLVVILGAFMYSIEGEENGFTSIPTSVYWAIVTLTTVGYGDISPKTPLGQALAAVIMVIGYSIIAVPTGIVSVELSRVMSKGGLKPRVCPGCAVGGHDEDAVHCKYCGAKLQVL